MKKEEKNSLAFIKQKIKKPIFLTSKEFKPGNMLFYSYNPKDDKSPYDRNPLIFVISVSKKHILGINLHWAPLNIRKQILKSFLLYNAKNIKNNKPLELSRNLASNFWRLARPIFRKYIKKRISRRGAIIKTEEMGNVINLRAEHFIVISAEDAWKLSLSKLKRN